VALKMGPKERSLRGGHLAAIFFVAPHTLPGLGQGEAFGDDDFGEIENG
jgi:hypothetical protein